MKTGLKRLIAVMLACVITSSAFAGTFDVYADELSEEGLIAADVIEETGVDEADADENLTRIPDEMTGPAVEDETVTLDQDLNETEEPVSVEEGVNMSADIVAEDEEISENGISDTRNGYIPPADVISTRGSALRFYGDGSMIKANQHIYFGKFYSQAFAYKDPNGGSKPYWRVLDANCDNNGKNGAIFLTSEELWGYPDNTEPTGASGIPFSSSSTDDTMDANTNNWLKSFARYWCKGFLKYSFFDEEKSAIRPITKTDPAGDILDGYGHKLDSYDECKLENDQVFFLSFDEVYKYLGDNYAGRLIREDNFAPYWLRTPSDQQDSGYNCAQIVMSNGLSVQNEIAESICYRNSSTIFIAARPALNINKSSILFVSDASNAKRSNGLGANCLQAVDGQRDIKDWKLTLLDSSRAFTATTSSDGKYVAPGGTVTVQYSGARTGANEYVSAILCDQSDNILYYGRIVNNSASGTANITIPSGVTEGNTYKLKVFSEQFNGDINDAVQQSTGRLSDIASNPREFTIKIPYNINKAALSATFYQYDAKAHIPAVTFGGRTLAANTDYTYVIKNSKGGVASAPVTADTYTMVLTGKGQYYGSCTLSYKIMPYDINGSALSPASFRYDGKVHIPAVTFNGKTLAVNTDYTYVIKDSKGAVTGSPKNAGTYSMILTGKGGYYKTSTKNFTITRLPNTLNVKAKSKTFTVKRPKLQKKKQVLKAKYNFKKKGQGKIKYSLLSATRSGRKYPAYFKVNSKNGQITMKRTSQVLPGTYTVKVNVKAAGNTNYEPKTVVVTFKVKVKKK